MPEKQGVNPPAAGALPKWEIYQYSGFVGTTVIMEDGRAIAEIYDPIKLGETNTAEKKRARACLMAAAPDLYEALERMCVEVERRDVVSDGALDDAHVALAKARGENATGALPAKPENTQKEDL